MPAGNFAYPVANLQTLRSEQLTALPHVSDEAVYCQMWYNGNLVTSRSVILSASAQLVSPPLPSLLRCTVVMKREITVKVQFNP